MSEDFETPIPIQRKITEKDVEAYLIRKMKALGGECYKWANNSVAGGNVKGVPDRICIFPTGGIYLVEVKRDRKATLSKNQKSFFERMRELNVTQCTVIYGKDGVDEWLRYWK